MRRVAGAVLEEFVRTLLIAHGASAEQAGSVARHMVWCEMVGRRNFGLERLAIHVKRIKAGVLDPRAGLKIAKLADNIERIDGGGGFGYHAAAHGMERAIAMAEASGVGIAGVKNSNFFGAGAFYVNMAAEAGMIGLAMSNSFPKVLAHGGERAVLGTNPFAFGAPRKTGGPLLFDMATSAMAGSTLRAMQTAGETPAEGLDASGVVLPFGGAKGFGLALMVELLAGVLTGAGISHGVASMYNDFTRSGDNGHFLLALDIGRWMSLDEYHVRFETLITALKTSGDGVLLPGEVRWRNYQDAQARGIALDDAVAASAAKLAAEVNLLPPWA